MGAYTSEQIRGSGLISHAVERGFRDTTYDLTVGDIIDDNHASHDRYRLKPRHMVWVVSQESVKVPGCLTGVALGKTTLTSQGILAINFGVLDPNTDCPISTLLINFGKKPFTVEKGMAFLRVLFIEHNEVAGEVKTTVRSDYIREKTKVVEDHFDNTFLDMTTLKRETVGVVYRQWGFFLGVAALVIAVLAVLPAIAQLYDQSHHEQFRAEIERLDDEVHRLQDLVQDEQQQSRSDVR